MGANPFDLLKNAQALQARMGSLQAKLETITAEGSSGGGMAKVRLNGKMEMLGVSIDRECFESADPRDDIPLVQDLVKAAYADAMAKVRESIDAEMRDIAGGLQIPPGLLGGL
jgi:nucleoid-associated protein EbfC